MHDGAATTETADEMRGSLLSDLEALVAAGEMDASEAADMIEWLGEA